MIKYRPEIDGLRAFAIVPVVLFHAGFSSFEGGFIGVDIFFVISGFLITSIIINDMEKDEFTITRFYERRVRRILPALFFVILLCIPPAVVLMLPSQLENFGNSVVAVMFFMSNVLFWNETGYFQQAAEMKPLLHTWSLAVEEQYYVIFPLFMALVWKHNQKAAISLLVIVVFASFLLAEWASHKHPVAGFFLLPTRAWELLVGSLGAIYVFRSGQLPNDKLALFGLVLIIGSIYFLDKGTPFPGVYAIPSVAGTVLLLICADKNTLIGRFLGQQFLVGIGLISYSAYLFHQPLFAFLRILHPNSDNAMHYYLLILLTFFLAYLSWKYVENPVRKIKASPQRLFGAAALTTFLLTPFGLALSSISAYPSDYRGEELFRKNVSNNCDFYAVAELDESCLMFGESRPNLLIWGDSHAWALSAGLRKVLRNDFNISQITTSACQPSESHLSPNEVEKYPVRSGGRTFGPACKKSNAFGSQVLRTNRIDVVIIAMAKNHLRVLSPHFVDFLKGNVSGRIMVIGPAPQWRDSLPKIASSWNGDALVRKLLKPNIFDVDASLKNMFDHVKYIKFASLIDYLCDKKGNSCAYEVPGARHEDRYITWDYGHLSLSGSDYVAEYLRPLIVETQLSASATE